MLLLAALAGCAEGEEGGAREPRPPAPLTVTAAIERDRVSVSPARFGAGPVVVLVSNQSGAPQRVTFETDELDPDQPGVTRTAGPVAPRRIARLALTLRPGTYALHTQARRIRPAAVTVGAPRPDSDGTLLLP